MDATDSLLVDTDNLETIEFKVLVVGEPTVGKSSLVKRYVNGCFDERYKSTIGVAHSDKTVIWKGIRITLQFWDLAGQDRLNNMAKVYFRGAAGALCVCDALREETRQQLDNWKEIIHEYTTHQDGTRSHPPCILVINKMDLYGKGIAHSWLSSKVTEDDSNGIQNFSLDGDKPTYSQEFYDSIEALSWSDDYDAGVPASAKLDLGIDLAISKLIDLMVKRYRELEKGKKDQLDGADGIVNLDSPRSGPDSEGGTGSRTPRNGCSC